MANEKDNALNKWLKEPDIQSISKILESNSKEDININLLIYQIVVSIHEHREDIPKDFITFNYLYSISNTKEDQLDQFIEAVYCLVRYPFNILNQRFRAFDDNKKRWQVLENYIVEEAYRDQEYCNPLNGKDISLKEFMDMVTPFFQLSEKGLSIFIEQVK